MRPPPVDVTPPALQEFRASEAGEPVPPGEWLSTGISLWQPPWQAGPVIARPHFGASYFYATGVLLNPGEPSSTTTFQFAPGVTFLLGSHWTLDYTPSFQWFSNNNFENTVNQNVSLNGWGTYEDWILSLSMNYSSSTTPQVETGTQTQDTLYSATLGASYRFNSKVSMDLGLNDSYQSAEGFQSYWQWAATSWVNYQFWPRFSAGLGLGLGYVDVSEGSNMTFEQLQARISWAATRKTSVTLHGGLEDRQFLSGGVAPLVSPVFGLVVQTSLGPKTSLSLTADHSVSSSYFANQASESSSVTLGISQALAKKLSLSLGGGLNYVTYIATSTEASANSSYNYITFTASLSYAIIKRGSISVTYQYGDNFSDQPGLSFSSNQIGVQLGYSF